MFDSTPSEESLGRLKERQKIVAFINQTYEQYENLLDRQSKDLLQYLLTSIEQGTFGNR